MTPSQDMAKAVLSEQDLEERTGIKVKTWQKWRGDGTGPAYVKLGALVRYRPRDVEAWLDSRTVAPKRGGAA